MDDVQRHILVVDDDTLVRRAVVRILRGARYAVITEASCATEAAELFFGNKSITTVLSDIQMSPRGTKGQDGHDLLALIHHELRSRNGLFFAMSGSSDPKVLEPFRKHDIPVISKPFEPQELLRFLR
jgi:CheY-like chemotaxis protein